MRAGGQATAALEFLSPRGAFSILVRRSNPYGSEKSDSGIRRHGFSGCDHNRCLGGRKGLSGKQEQQEISRRGVYLGAENRPAQSHRIFYRRGSQEGRVHPLQDLPA